MAYPTTLNFLPSSPIIGLQPINATSATQNHPLGTMARAVDSAYGEGTFIYLKGVANTAAGDVVAYDAKAGTTTRAVAATRGPMAVAMSANVANQYGWYQVEGAGVVNSTAAGTGAANSLLCTTATAGQTTVSGTAGQKIEGILCTTAQGGPGAGFTGVQMDWPSANGNT